MSIPLVVERERPALRLGAWSAVFALTLCVSTLIASEFMPVSLLTPLATDLQVTEGRAGLAISVSGIFAVLTSLYISSVTRRLDRRTVLLALTGLMLLSGAVTAIAPNFPVLMVGRALLGVVIGGFWSMSTATVMRLVEDKDVPRALALLNGGNALATMVAAPLGSFLGQFIGWRGAFFAVVPLAALTLAWLFASLPAMPSERTSPARSALAVLKKPHVPLGIAAVTLLFAGQFALFTYLRPFLETVTRVNVTTLSLLLLILGIAGLAGNYVIGFALRTRLWSLLVGMPLAMAAVALALVGFGSSAAETAVLLAVWGMIGTAAPVAWWTWLARTLPQDAEDGGGLMVAAIQLAITLGAAAGGLLFDASGYASTFTLAALLLAGSAAAALVASRAAARSPSNPQEETEL